MFSICLGPRALAALASLAAACSLASAQSDPSITSVVITAARVEQALADALPSTRVITRKEIEAAQAADLPALLRMLTSIDVGQTGPMGSQASLFLRGGDSRQTLVLVDGVPLQRADFGTPSWQHLMPEQIERIEIVRGNLSALHGAQAVGGVVHIVTRGPSAPQVDLALGSRGTQGASFAGGAAMGDPSTPTRLSASLGWRRTDGFSARDAAVDPTANPDRDGARQVGGSARVDQNWAAGHRTELALLATRTRSGYDGFAPGLDDVLTTQVQAAGLKSRHAVAPGLQLVAELGQSSERFDDPTGFAVSGRNRIRLGGLQLGWSVAPGHDLQLGAETRRERFVDSGTPARTRITDSLRMAWLGRPAAGWQTQMALRSDDSSDFGRATTGLFALAWQWQPSLKLSAQWATGFSAPSFLDQQFAAPGVLLRPERSRQGELALQWSERGRSLRAAAFVQRQRDRVAFDPVTFEAGNIARASNRGLELMLQTPVPFDADGVLTSDVTLQDPRDRDTGLRLKRRARASAALNYVTRFAQWHSVAALRHTGKRLDTDPLTFGNADNPSRTTLDLSLSREIVPGWRLGVKVDNATGSDTPEVLGYTAPPRSVMMSLQGRWR
jgi:vitamin B12 transporter